LSNINTFLKIFRDIDSAKICHPRNLNVKELINYNFVLYEPFDRFIDFHERKLNIKYIIAELAWYLRGNLFLDGIDHYAKFWGDICDKNGTINSNYGYYIFKEGQFNRIIDKLKEDMYTRQAIIIINRPDVLFKNTKDQICTTSLHFLIRDDKLHLIVNMRSNDLIFGLCNDLPFFTILQEFILNIMIDFYPQLKMGNYFHNDGSLHVYERHFDLVKNILNNARREEIYLPKIKNSEEVYYIIDNLGNDEIKLRNNIEVKNHDNFDFYNSCINILK